MNRAIPHFAAGTTATNASIAGLAAVGLVFLVPSPQWRELASVTVPGVALLLVIALQLLHQHLTDYSTAQARAAAQVDSITGLPALPVAELVLSTEFAAAERGRELTIMLCRIDAFHRFRAAHGVEAAERLLALSGRVFNRRTRGMNLSARYDDNGTFVTILSGQTTRGARIFAERVQKDLMALEVADDPQSVSIGITTFEPHIGSPGELLRAVEKAVRDAEQIGATIVVQGETNSPSYSR
ncbi:MAG: diguanylate cyclase [Gemmatimonadota bacterium]